MSGYFNALIRLSGLGAANAAALPSHDELGLEESVPFEAPVLNPAAELVDTPGSPTVRALTAQSSAGPQESTDARTAAVVIPTAQVRELLEYRGVETSVPEVRAALKWIASPDLSDQSPDAKVTRANAIAAEEPLPTPGRAVLRDIEAGRTNGALREPARSAPPVSSRPVPVEIPIAAAVPEVFSPTGSRTDLRQPPAVEESIEISIGSIHLRVDAPAGPPVPAPVPRHLAPDRRASSLSRRALPEI